MNLPLTPLIYPLIFSIDFNHKKKTKKQTRQKKKNGAFPPLSPPLLTRGGWWEALAKKHPPSAHTISRGLTHARIPSLRNLSPHTTPTRA